MIRSGPYDYDVAILADFRYPGGTSVSLAEEIKAQASAGYTTALVPMQSPQLKKRRAFHPQVVSCIQAGLARLVAADEELRVKALLTRHPALFNEDPDPRPRISADVVLMVANQTPGDGTAPGGAFYYDAIEVDWRLRELLGDRVLWAPIGPAVREALRQTGASLPLIESDWHNVLDTDEWWTDRSRFVSDKPVIGRHSRPHWKKWPDAAADILAAYPEDDAVRVKILGGGEVATSIIGRRPENWTLYPFGSLHPKRFLREIDFEVYYHHPEWIEAFGRTIVEGLASACPVIVPPHFQGLFEDACIYARPAEVLGIVRRLHDDPDSYRMHSERGYAFVRESFGHQTHHRRLRSLIGEPTGRRHAPRRPRGQRRVIFFTANGEGMGHLTRAMAIARRLPPSVKPVFVTLSLGMSVVRESGFLCEYIPKDRGTRWHELLEQRLVEIVRRYDADGLVFDGTSPYSGLIGAKLATGLPLAWVRRAMWQRGRGEANLSREGHFDLVIEPGELAKEYDQGATTRHRGKATSVPPILLLDQAELLDRDEARAALGLGTRNRAILLQLGSGNAYDIAALAQVTAERLTKAPDTDVVFADWRIARQRIDLPAQVKRVETYPIGRYLQAFDFAISAAGYNCFHELIAAGVPTIFVPMEKELDDQLGRARYAEDVGAGLNMDPLSEARLDHCLELVQAEASRSAMASRCREILPGNGAQDAADALARMWAAALPEAVLR